jgi:hypothetical protein
MAKRQRPRQIKPDEVFETDAFAIARVGKDVIWQSKLTKRSHAQYQKQWVEQYPKIVAEIDRRVAAVAEQVSQLQPERLLHRAWWEMASRHVKITAEAEVSVDDATSMRMIDYIQSVIASVKPSETQKADVSEEDWTTLRTNVESLFRTLNLSYQICRTAKAKSENPNYDEEAEEFFYKAQMYWCNVRGARYQTHEEMYLRDVFLPHSVVFEELFGIPAEAFVQELMKIWRNAHFRTSANLR